MRTGWANRISDGGWEDLCRGNVSLNQSLKKTNNKQVPIALSAKGAHHKVI